MAKTVEASSLFLDTPSIVELDPESFKAAKESNDVWFTMWYSPWCGHCIHFAPTWKKFGAWFNGVASIHIGALNCVEHKQFCKDNDVRGYPTLRAMNIAGEGEPDGNVFDIGLHMKFEDLINFVNDRFPGVGVVSQMNPEKFFEISADTSENQIQPATCNDRFIDAASSLHYTLLNNVAVSGGIISEDRIDALVSILTVVARGLPGLANKASVNRLIDELVESEYMLEGSLWEKKVSEWRIGVHEPENGWPAAAQEGSRDAKDIVNYNSGVWTLFHIMTLSHSPNSASPVETMEGIRLFVDKLFPCKSCRVHFLSEYDSCNFGACLVRDVRRDMILWLWRMHNSVNVRLAREKNVQEDDLIHFYWPKQGRCPSCWSGLTDYGQPVWNEQAVLLHLQSTYWCREWNLSEPSLNTAVFDHFAAITNNPFMWILVFVTVCCCWYIAFRANRSKIKRRKSKITLKASPDDDAKLRNENSATLLNVGRRRISDSYKAVLDKKDIAV